MTKQSHYHNTPLLEPTVVHGRNGFHIILDFYTSKRGNSCFLDPDSAGPAAFVHGRHVNRAMSSHNRLIKI